MIISIVTIISTGLTPLLIVVTFWPVYSQFQKIIDAKTWSYSKEQMKVIRSHIMKQNADFQEDISQA